MEIVTASENCRRVLKTCRSECLCNLSNWKIKCEARNGEAELPSQIRLPFKELQFINYRHLRKYAFENYSISENAVLKFLGLRSIAEYAFSRIQNVQYIEIYATNLTVNKFAFSGLEAIQLSIITRGYNPSFDNSVFANATIETLIIDNDRNVAAMGIGVFISDQIINYTLPTVRSYILQEAMALINLNSKGLPYFVNTTFIRIQHCDLSRILPFAFFRFSKLQHIDLSFNQITYIDPSALEAVTQLETLDLSNNPLINFAFLANVKHSIMLRFLHNSHSDEQGFCLVTSLQVNMMIDVGYEIPCTCIVFWLLARHHDYQWKYKPRCIESLNSQDRVRGIEACRTEAALYKNNCNSRANGKPTTSSFTFTQFNNSTVDIIHSESHTVHSKSIFYTTSAYSTKENGFSNATINELLQFTEISQSNDPNTTEFSILQQNNSFSNFTSRHGNKFSNFQTTESAFAFPSVWQPLTPSQFNSDLEIEVTFRQTESSNTIFPLTSPKSSNNESKIEMNLPSGRLPNHFKNLNNVSNESNLFKSVDSLKTIKLNITFQREGEHVLLQTVNHSIDRHKSNLLLDSNKNISATKQLTSKLSTRQFGGVRSQSSDVVQLMIAGLTFIISIVIFVLLNYRFKWKSYYVKK
ncbi:hypothetical protein GJ496_001797 [Pomphorhynchus laevis]|nr:hypothetical protein GJ496_001797 [Pomphorhynchus laevis]